MSARTSSTLRVIGIVALVALLAELLALPLLIGLDDVLWRTILHLRGCGWDQRVALATDVATVATILLLALAAVASLRTTGLRFTWPPLAVCACGLLAGKVLKNFFARERPSIVAEVALGHSFPSAHVMNTALAAIAIVVLTARLRRTHRWRVLPGVLLIANCAGRLLIGRHWLSDVVGALLAAVALSCLALPAFRRRPLVAPSLVSLALAAVLSVDLGVRSMEIRLPSPLTVPQEAIAQVSTGTAIGTPILRGEWSAGTKGVGGFPSAPRLQGSGVVGIEVPEPTIPGKRRRDGGASALLAFVGLPDTTAPACATLRVAINGAPLRPFVPFQGWREYRLIIPAGTVHPGRNEVQFDFLSDGGAARTLAIAYVRLVLR